ncbi:MAG: 30S ribosomal protein S2 [Chloroflexi bacterium]|nr:30S ribosomal protein S2 [Chloroflexota bacterium]
MAVVSMKSLLEAGVHFGHRTPRWNPKMKSFIFTERNGIHIIDLQQTIARLEDAFNFVRDMVSRGGVVLFVGTKKQAADTVRGAAESCAMPYVNQRWLGGTLTNFRTIHQRTQYLSMLEEQRAKGQLDRLTKKEAQEIESLIQRLNVRLGGLKQMERLPDALFVIDVTRETLAVKEAHRLGIPIIAMVDTNGDPDLIDYCIPSNDDAIRAIKLMTGRIADAASEGLQLRATLRAESGEEEDEELALAEEMLDQVDLPEVTEEDLLGPSTLEKIRAAQQDVGYEIEELGDEDLAEAPAAEDAGEEITDSPEAAE